MLSSSGWLSIGPVAALHRTISRFPHLCEVVITVPNYQTKAVQFTSRFKVHDDVGLNVLRCQASTLLITLI